MKIDLFFFIFSESNNNSSTRSETNNSSSRRLNTTAIPSSTTYYRERKCKNAMWECFACSKQLKLYAKNNQIQHLNTHLPMEERPFKCSECDLCYVQKAHLDNHIKLVHVMNKTPLAATLICPISSGIEQSKTKGKRF